MNKNRLENFSDGVFAIAVTLLILNVRIPDAKITDTNHLDQLLHRIIPHLITFFITFLVVGIFWVAHHRIFSFVKVLDSTMLWLNILYLMFIALIPVPAGLLSENPLLPNAILIYTITLFIIASMHFILLEYMLRHKTLIHEAMTRVVYKSAQKTAIVGPVCYIAAAAASYVNVYISFFFITVSMLFYIFLAGRTKVQEKLIETARKEADD